VEDRRVITVESVRAGLDTVQRRIAGSGGRDVTVVAVTKGFGPDAIECAVAAGCIHVGENYAQELLSKRDAAASASVHFIGRLQTNKVRSIADVVDVWETVDRGSVVDELARRAPGARVLLQLNATGEADKGGCPVDEVDGLFEHARAAGLEVLGLMTVGPTEGGPEAARPAFRTVRRRCDDLGLTVCSMGMSDDLEVAVAEGSTEVRVGTALFGRRPPHARSPRPR
jgi:pyridoxal phosphate enzyme (YggS family)